MKEAREIDWLRWFYRNAGSITEEEREELEDRFYQEEGLLLPTKYRVDDIDFAESNSSALSVKEIIIKGAKPISIEFDYEKMNEVGKRTKGIKCDW